VFPARGARVAAERGEARVERGRQVPVGIAHPAEEVAAGANPALAEQLDEEIPFELVPAGVFENLYRTHCRSPAPARPAGTWLIPPTACTRHGCSTYVSTSGGK